MATEQIIIFDGVCNFCNGAVNFIIKRDAKAVFKFAPLQTEIAQRLMLEYQIKEETSDTFVLIKDGRYFVRTDAALEIIKDLGRLWFVLQIFKIVPVVVRDYFYNLLAKNRYKLFGKQEHCMMPSKEVRDRFLI